MSERCEEEGCETFASFGLPEEGKKRRWCGAPGHGPAEKEDVLNRRRCEEKGCTTQASFGLQEEGKPRWCTKHGPEDTVYSAKFRPTPVT